MTNNKLQVNDILRSNISSDQSTSHNFFSSSRDDVDGINTVTVETSYLLEGGELLPSNSANIVFSLWSTMIGSTLLAMPRVVRDTGIISALVGTFVVCVSNTYTVQLMEKLGRYHNNNGAELVKDAGMAVYMFGTVVSVIVLLGANTIYNIYICDGLMNIASIDPRDEHYRPIFAVSVAAVFFLVGLLKSLKPLFRAASYAIVIVIFIVSFMIGKAGQQLSKGDQCPSAPPLPINGTFTSIPKHVDLVWRGFGPFVQNCATMSLSLYIHSLVLPIMNLATRPRNNPRDLVLAFIATAASVVGPASLVAFAFKDCDKIDSDFLDMFDDVETMIARGAVVLLVGIVYPILLYNARNQLLGILFGRDDFPYWAHVVFNVLAIALTTVPNALDVSTTVVAAIVGICAVFWVTFLPVGMWWRHVKLREPARLTVWFYVVNILVLLFGVVLVATTIIAEASDVLN